VTRPPQRTGSIATASADDLAAARTWYPEFLGVGAYFEVPGGYIEFRIGDSHDELGIVPRSFGNVLGFMYNQHYLDVLRERAANQLLNIM
jgi:hypothetical protein